MPQDRQESTRRDPEALQDENIHIMTHENMKNDRLSGDKIDRTTRGNQEDFEIDRQVVDNKYDLFYELPHDEKI